jgi:hypothetical protein
VAIPPGEAEKSGLLLDQVKISEKYGGGFPANVEGLHQLHCLVNNFLRSIAICADLVPVLRIFSASRFIIILSTTTRLAKELLQIQIISSGTMFVSADMSDHKDGTANQSLAHCLDIIRQQLMCTVDTGVLGQVWWNPTRPQAYVDFNTRHKCKNFDTIRQWAEDHQLPERVPVDFLQPPEEGDTIYEHIP